MVKDYVRAAEIFLPASTGIDDIEDRGCLITRLHTFHPIRSQAAGHCFCRIIKRAIEGTEATPSDAVLRLFRVF
jgi:hypothetical protein